MGDWKNFSLGDVCIINVESYSKNDNWDFVNYLDTGNITANHIENIQRINIGQEKLPSRARRKVKYNSIIYSTVRPNQRHYGIIKSQPQNFLVSTGFAVIDVNSEVVDADFLYYQLSRDDIVDKLHMLAEQSTSTYPSIRPADIENLRFSLPPLKTQKKIAAVLSALDDKIELNNAINKNLEEQAQAIFKKMFPAMISNEIFVGEYITPKRGKNLLVKDTIRGEFPVVAGGLEPATYHNESNTVAPVLTISASGANAGYVKLWNVPVWSSDSSFIDSSMTEDVYFWYVMLKLRQEEIFHLRTGTAQQHIYPKHIAQLPIKKLNEYEVKEFTKRVTPLFSMIGANTHENQKLGEIRDALLPRLMSGEIDVSAVEI